MSGPSKKVKIDETIAYHSPKIQAILKNISNCEDSLQDEVLIAIELLYKGGCVRIDGKTQEIFVQRKPGLVLNTDMKLTKEAFDFLLENKLLKNMISSPERQGFRLMKGTKLLSDAHHVVMGGIRGRDVLRAMGIIIKNKAEDITEGVREQMKQAVDGIDYQSKRVQNIIDDYDALYNDELLQEEVYAVMRLMSQGYMRVVERASKRSIHAFSYLTVKSDDEEILIPMSYKCALFFQRHPDLTNIDSKTQTNDKMMMYATSTLHSVFSTIDNDLQIRDIPRAILAVAKSKIRGKIKKIIRRKKQSEVTA